MWYDAEYSTRPLEVDETISASFVYLRKDIEETKKEEDVIYTCKEKQIPKSDWELYRKILSHDVELSEVQDALIELSEMIVEG